MLTRQNDRLFDRALRCLLLDDIDAKLAATQSLAQAWYQGRLSVVDNRPAVVIDKPGLPVGLRCVHPSEVPRRRLGSPEGKTALLHAIAHIEFNAINLALDAVYRFRGLPSGFYDDWIRIACEECYHFALIRKRLNRGGVEYGELPAHQGLWDVAQYSADDVIKRMALVPRVLEARGLDVTPGIMQRIAATGDTTLVEILNIIHRDEIGHVAAGSHWFRYVCGQRGLPAERTFEQILQQYIVDMNAHIKGPFDEAVRRQAGFTDNELQILHTMEATS